MKKILSIASAFSFAFISSPQATPPALQQSKIIQEYLRDNAKSIQAADQETQQHQQQNRLNQKLGAKSPTHAYIVEGQDINVDSLKLWHLKGPEQTLSVWDKASNKNIEYPLEGINLEKAARLLGLNKNFSGNNPVVVAITDGGVNTHHEYIRPYAWVNEREFFDGKDEDNNAFIDDRFGWDFIGKGIDGDSLEISRIYHQCQAGLSPLNNGEPVDCGAIATAYAEALAGCQDDVGYYHKIRMLFAAVDKVYNLGWSGSEGLISQSRKRKIQLKFDAQGIQNQQEELRVRMIEQLIPLLDQADSNAFTILTSGPLYSTLVKEGKSERTNDVSLLKLLISRLVRYDYFFWEGLAVTGSYDCSYHLGAAYVNKREPSYDSANPRKAYGTPNAIGLDPSHGTHVAGTVIGIVEAALGKAAATKALKIMAVRVVPNGDERDHDVGNAVAYAVNSGAHLINMSFGKDYSADKDYVDANFALAEKRGVGITMSAGNSAKEINKYNDFPNTYYRTQSGRKFNNVLVVGASNFVKSPISTTNVAPAYQKLTLGGYSTILAGFSNYSQEDVDLFAPGTFIYATYSKSITEDNRYSFLQGTSMASPVVTGVEALVLTQFPRLKNNAAELRKIILKATRPYDVPVYIAEGDTTKEVSFRTLSATGGVIDAYLALCEASHWSKTQGGKTLKGCNS